MVGVPAITHLRARTSSKSGKYKKERAPDFAWMITVQWLSKEYPAFMKQFMDKVSNFKARANIVCTGFHCRSPSNR